MTKDKSEQLNLLQGLVVKPPLAIPDFNGDFEKEMDYIVNLPDEERAKIEKKNENN